MEHDPYGEAAQRWAQIHTDQQSSWALGPDQCLIRGCADTDMNPDAPIALRDGSLWRACRRHHAAIMSLLVPMMPRPPS